MHNIDEDDDNVWGREKGESEGIRNNFLILINK